MLNIHIFNTLIESIYNYISKQKVKYFFIFVKNNNILNGYKNILGFEIYESLNFLRFINIYNKINKLFQIINKLDKLKVIKHNH